MMYLQSFVSAVFGEGDAELAHFVGALKLPEEMVIAGSKFCSSVQVFQAFQKASGIDAAKFLKVKPHIFEQCVLPHVTDFSPNILRELHKQSMHLVLDKVQLDDEMWQNVIGHAVSENMVQMIEVLAKVRPNFAASTVYCNDADNNLLFAAVLKNAPGSVRALLPLIDVNTPDANGTTPLLHAILDDHLKCVVALLESGKCDFSIANNEGVSPASVLSDLSNSNGKYVAEAIIFVEMNRQLAARGVKSNTVQRSTSNGDSNKASDYANHSVDQIVKLVEAESPEFVAKLLNESALNHLTNDDLITLLQLALGCKNEEFLKSVANRMDPDTRFPIEKTDNCTPFHACVRMKYAEAVPILIKYFDINAQDENGNTALHLAVKKGNEFLVRALLETGKIDFAVQNKNRCTAEELKHSEFGKLCNARLISTALKMVQTK